MARGSSVSNTSRGSRQTERSQGPRASTLGSFISVLIFFHLDSRKQCRKKYIDVLHGDPCWLVMKDDKIYGWPLTAVSAGVCGRGEHSSRLPRSNRETAAGG